MDLGLGRFFFGGGMEVVIGGRTPECGMAAMFRSLESKKF